MKQFKKDVMHWKDYDFAVINDNLDSCYKLIINFIKSKRNNKKFLKYDKKYINNHINHLIN